MSTIIWGWHTCLTKRGAFGFWARRSTKYTSTEDVPCTVQDGVVFCSRSKMTLSFATVPWRIHDVFPCARNGLYFAHDHLCKIPPALKTPIFAILDGSRQDHALDADVSTQIRVDPISDEWRHLRRCSKAHS